MKEVIFSSVAEQEVLEAICYYDSEVEGLGKAFLEKLEATTQHIKKFPESSRILREDYRRCLLPRFPHGVIFRIEGERIYILAVMHLKRKPFYWVDELRDS